MNCETSTAALPIGVPSYSIQVSAPRTDVVPVRARCAFLPPSLTTSEHLPRISLKREGGARRARRLPDVLRNLSLRTPGVPQPADLHVTSGSPPRSELVAGARMGTILASGGASSAARGAYSWAEGEGPSRRPRRSGSSQTASQRKARPDTKAGARVPKLR